MKDLHQIAETKSGVLFTFKKDKKEIYSVKSLSLGHGSNVKYIHCYLKKNIYNTIIVVLNRNQFVV